jgi:O-antigen/teichoic acid export membrane protein
MRLRERMGETLLVAYASGVAGQILNQVYFFGVLYFLTIDEVGVYAWALAASTLYAYITDFGVTPFLVSELASNHYRFRQVVRFLIGVRLPSIAGAVIIFSLFWTLGSPNRIELMALALIGGSHMLLLLELGLVSWLQHRQRQRLVNILNLLVPVGRCVGLGVLVLSSSRPSLLHVSGLVFAVQLVSLGAFAVFSGPELTDHPNELGQPWSSERRLLKAFLERGPVLTAVYAMMAAQARLDWLFVSALLTKGALANYAVANKLLELAMLLAGIWARTSFPWFAQIPSDPAIESKLILGRKIFTVLSALVAVLLFAWGPLIFRVLFGTKYVEAEPTIRLLAITATVFMLNQYFVYVLIAEKLESAYARILFPSILVQILVDVLLIPILGIMGAAWGMVVMGISVHIGQLYLLTNSRVIQREDVFRAEAFVVAMTAITITLWALSAAPMVSTIVGTVAIAVGSSIFLLDRAELVGLIRFARLQSWGT